MGNPAIVVDFLANTKDLQKGMSAATGASKGFGDKLKTLGKVAGAAALGGLVATIKIGIDEFAQASKVAAQTNAVLKSTGGVANVTADQVNNLSGALMKKTGIDDEAIQSGENLLLTFTDIRNEAGKGNDVFTQATKTMTDMSVALGQDMKTSAIQLGKALNNPIKGMTALQRVGVTFTQAQKDQVAAMVKAGDTMGAQKLILGELNKEFGGSAEAVGKTLPGQLNILKQEFSNFAGVIVGAVVPPLTDLLKLLMSHRDIVVPLVAVFAGLAGVLLTVSAATKAWAAIQLVAKAATVAWTAVQWLLNAALTANPIGLVVVAIAALVAAFVLAYTKVKVFRDAINTAFDAILAAAKAVIAWLRTNWPLIAAILMGPIGIAALAIAKNWDKITDGARAAVGWIKDAFNDLVGFIGSIVGKIGRAASSVADAIKAPINAVINAWNGLEFHVPKVDIPKVHIPGLGTIGGGSIGGETIGFPDIPTLARGGVVSGPTLAMIGEGAGREIVAPESLLRDIVGAQSVSVRVFIGDTELRGIVDAQVDQSNTRIARNLLAGGAG